MPAVPSATTKAMAKISNRTMRTSNLRIGGSIALPVSQRSISLPIQRATMKPITTTTSAEMSAPLWLMTYSMSLSCQAAVFPVLFMVTSSC